VSIWWPVFWFASIEGRNRVTTHQAKFGDTTCEVDIEPQPTVNGAPVFEARLFQLDSNGNALRPIHNDKDSQEIRRSHSEQAALGAAAEFFESRFGAKQTEWTDPTLTREIIDVLPPRRHP
jgi:hypothetical protein